MNLILSKIDQFVMQFSKQPEINPKSFGKFQREFSKQNGGTPFFHKDELLKSYQKLVCENIIGKNINIEKVLRLKQTRSLSGIVVVSVLTKPYDCPGQCLYCPQEKDVPKSYLSDEPAVMRAITCNYHPYLQVTSRLKALQNTGHKTSKINIRIIGGTWSYYQKAYRTWFIKECFRACNDFGHQKSKYHTLYELQKLNESAKSNVVEISIETRQDFVDRKEILFLRKLGVTKVELGIQSIYEEVLRRNNRGHDIATTLKAITDLKNSGFKISYQIMLNLPGSDYQKDLEMIKELFSNPGFKPDYLKIYPLALVKEAPIYNLYKKGEFKPYDGFELKQLLKEIKKLIPYYCRVERVIRDIPSQYIVEGGSKISNLRQVIQNEMLLEGSQCKCIRCREIRDNYNATEKLKLFVDGYNSSDGKEFFISFESNDRKYIHSLLRLRLTKTPFLETLENCAFVREVHTYGDQLTVSDQSSTSAQHKGLGQKMLKEAEKIAAKNGFKKIAVIAGVGVRNYFRKFGYELENTYMIKDL